ncbi:Membrane-bound lytic murein transglycosylase D [hydrothermal vent metagenome]|uniref:Membrane-bound lytic murein transglycosylase D n=1 Tax=hydrothermal vent metagenome TaxID=652676 RepID=A0A3B0XZE4_9ZZZZ
MITHLPPHKHLTLRQYCFTLEVATFLGVQSGGGSIWAITADKNRMAFRNLILIISGVILLAACVIISQPEPAEISVSEAAEDRGSPQVILSATVLPVTGIETKTPPPTDLWQAMREHFGLLPQTDNPRIRVQRDWYIKHPRYMDRVTERASRYAWHIHQALAERDMPAEIALLPIVESAYDPFAYSHGRAAGLWQFIPGTGKHFKLAQNWWYDGRRDVVDSTRAALDYLQYLHKRFDSDWLLALAAYNSGEGTVSRAIRRNRKLGKLTNFWALKLPGETRAYVPKLIALAQLVDHPETYAIELANLPNQAYFQIVDIGGQIDLAVAADLAGIELDALYRLNPGFNQWATTPDGPHRLLIPVNSAATFRQAIAQLPPEKRVQWNRHKVKTGETLSHIAKHYHTSTEVLQAANQINGTSIRAGKHLMVPVSSQSQDAYKLSAGQRLSRKQNTSRKGFKTRHVVANGDTLWDLSREYKVGLRSLAAWNGMAPGDPLRIGQTLVVWTKQGNNKSLHPGARARPVYYTVRKGDSLSRIAGRFKVSVKSLRRWNGLPSNKYLHPGQRLKLYVDVTRQTGA